MGGGRLTLGNHTYSHKSINDTPLEAYQADVLKGELATRRLLDAPGHQLVWFRHPYTHTGPTAEIKGALDAFLNEHGYRVAPFTIEAADYAFAAVYERALMAGADQGPRRRWRPIWRTRTPCWHSARRWHWTRSDATSRRSCWRT